MDQDRLILKLNVSIMKKKIMPFILLLAGLFSFSLFSINSLPIGASIPKNDLILKDISGKEITLKDAKKEAGLLVMFSCNTCPVVIRNQARTKEICAFALSKNIGVVLLNSNEASRQEGDSYEDMQSYSKRQGYTWFYVLDRNHEVADAFGANRTPESFLFDKTGKLAYHGGIDDNPSNQDAVKRHHLREAIEEMSNGKEITVKESRSVGCSIRR
jgi:peroxiredoxin